LEGFTFPHAQRAWTNQRVGRVPAACTKQQIPKNTLGGKRARLPSSSRHFSYLDRALRLGRGYALRTGTLCFSVLRRRRLRRRFGTSERETWDTTRGALLSVDLIWVDAIVDTLDLCCYNTAILYHLTTILSWALFSLAVVSSSFQLQTTSLNSF
jgi:hypothetical protein